MVKVMAVDARTDVRRLGFMIGEITVPEDFDQMGNAEIERLFGADV